MPAVAQSLAFAGSLTDDPVEDPVVVLSLCVNAVQSATLAYGIFEEEAGIIAVLESFECNWRR